MVDKIASQQLQSVKLPRSFSNRQPGSHGERPLYLSHHRNAEIFEAASQNYRLKLEALLEAHRHRIPEGSVFEAEIQHEDRCAINNGHPRCTCNPEVCLVIEGVRYHSSAQPEQTRTNPRQPELTQAACLLVHNPKPASN